MIAVAAHYDGIELRFVENGTRSETAGVSWIRTAVAKRAPVGSRAGNLLRRYQLPIPFP